MSRFRLLAAVILLIAQSAFAEFSRSAVSFQFMGLSGNTGGVSMLGGSYRYDWFEAMAASFQRQTLVSVGARKDFNSDSVFIPHMALGVALTPLFSVMPGLGFEIMSPPMSGMRFGLRLNQYVMFPVVLPGYLMSSMTTVGASCHF